MTPRNPKPQREPLPGAWTVEQVLADNLYVWRKWKRWTQNDLAKRMRHVGFDWTGTTVSEIERRVRQLRATEVFALALCFRIPIPKILDPAGVVGRDFPIDVGVDVPLPVRTANHWFHGRVVVGFSEDISDKNGYERSLGALFVREVEGFEEAFAESKEELNQMLGRDGGKT